RTLCQRSFSMQGKRLFDFTFGVQSVDPRNCLWEYIGECSDATSRPNRQATQKKIRLPSKVSKIVRSKRGRQAGDLSDLRAGKLCPNDIAHSVRRRGCRRPDDLRHQLRVDVHSVRYAREVIDYHGQVHLARHVDIKSLNDGWGCGLAEVRW